ncbi:hypothetical protein K439DRAFT_1379042 [Ramaria rubella]|nr:hypothetical protein K439DRAFT_1379042 [Ramaria rubella]
MKSTTNDFLFPLTCMLIDSENTAITSYFPVDVHPNTTVGKFKKAIHEELPPEVRSHIAAVQLQLWRLQPPPDISGRTRSTIQGFNDKLRSLTFPDPESDSAFNDKDGVQLLHPIDTISHYWKESPEPTCLHLVVRVPPVLVFPNIPAKRTAEAQAGEKILSKRQKFEEARKHNVELARLAPPPSSAAPLVAFRVEQEKRPVLNGRPSKNFGPPIGLFHPVFDLFQANMTKEDPVALETYTSVKSLFQASAEMYSEEKYRTAEISKHLKNLVYGTIAPVIADKVVSDGVITAVYGVTHAYLGILEVKNEIGTAGSDPSIQGCLAYRKYWIAATQDDLRSKCYCPTIILAIAGPWLCVLGAVYVEQAIVQPLTDYLWLGGDAFSDSRIISMGRMFNALESAFSTLRHYYTDTINAHDRPDGFPFIRSYETEKFSYLEKLAEEYPVKLVFKAKRQSSGELLVVKFASKYNADAHRLLAEKRLAPTLYYAGSEHPEAPKYGGRYMIVMEFVEEEPPRSDILSPGQASQIKEAIELLHSHNWVFGDLRIPNVLITGKGAMLIDFDWCSRADEGLYPMSMNQEGIDWAEGMVPGGRMKEKHDLDMLQKLCRRG